MHKTLKLSLSGFLGVLLLLSLGAAAQGTSIKQRILMPGPLIEAHAEFEADCSTCHVSFDKGGLTNLCLDCHDEIRADRTQGFGFHGKSPVASAMPCNTCHTDHIGRDADIINLHIDRFEHQFTNFPLEGRHSALECSSCHTPGDSYRDAEPRCASCHQDDDVHRGALGTDCQTCHKPHSWQQRLPFNHDDTGFSLKGLHAEVACSSCHAGQVYEFPSTDCVSCHKAADVHAGKNGQNCATCHSEDGWGKRIFDHNTTQFPLRFKHAEAPCRACHTDGVVAEVTPMQCRDCHSNDDVHQGRNGDQCQTCHQSSGWDRVKFDHARETGFPLTGKHHAVACTSCHTGALSEPLGRDCRSCHAADDIHRSPDMQVCATCHVTDGWHIINRFDHDLTHFPLVGMHQVVACQSCHVGNQFTGTGTDCVSCHKEDDYHRGAMGKECSSCHSPNAWNIWQFDHEQHTGYALQGAHYDLQCAACHAPGSKPGSVAPVCGSCHQSQDIHDGEFGNNCGRCHSQTRFYELILQD